MPYAPCYAFRYREKINRDSNPSENQQSQLYYDIFPNKTKRSKNSQSKGSDNFPIILQQGLSRSLEYWLGFEKALSASHTVIAFDTRGLGKSKECPVPWNLSAFDLADDIIAVLDHAGYEKAHVFGLSLGGMIALAAGLKHPDRVASVCALNASIGNRKALRMSPGGIAMMAKAVVQKNKHENIVEDWVRLMTSRSLSDTEKQAIKRKWSAIVSEHGMTPYDVSAKHLLAGMRFDSTLELDQISVPVNIMYGSHDFFVPFFNSKVLHHKIPHSKLTEIPDAGHEAHADNPEGVQQAYLSFLEEVR